MGASTLSVNDWVAFNAHLNKHVCRKCVGTVRDLTSPQNNIKEIHIILYNYIKFPYGCQHTFSK